MPTVNAERKQRRKELDEVYGSFHRHVCALPCTLAKYPGGHCWGTVAGHHLKTVGAGGKDAENEVPLCDLHHTEVHALGPTKFELRYHGLDLDLTAGAVWAAYCDQHEPMTHTRI